MKSRTNISENSVEPIGMNSPNFNLKIIDLDHRLEQRRDDIKEIIKQAKIGDPIQGKSFLNKKTHRGRIQKIKADEKGNVVYVYITDEKGKVIKLDPLTMSKLNLNDGNIKNESLTSKKVMVFEEWLTK